MQTSGNKRLRLPQLAQSNDRGYVYVLQRGDVFKIGFSRHNVARRMRENRASLVLVVPVGQRPAQLERLIQKRFAAKLLPDHLPNYGGKREWFSLDAADLAWLRGLVEHLQSQS